MVIFISRLRFPIYTLVTTFLCFCNLYFLMSFAGLLSSRCTVSLSILLLTSCFCICIKLFLTAYLHPFTVGWWPQPRYWLEAISSFPSQIENVTDTFDGENYSDVELTDDKPLTDYLYENEKDVKNVVVSTIYLTTFSVLNTLQQLMVC